VPSPVEGKLSNDQFVPFQRCAMFVVDWNTLFAVNPTAVQAFGPEQEMS
jgi:hypothetical protein